MKTKTIKFIYGVFVMSLFSCIQLHAQTPQNGIYKYAPGQDRILPIPYYAKKLVNPGKLFQVHITPYLQTKQFGLKYALVAIDSEKNMMKIAFLRDTVSQQAKHLQKHPIQDIMSYTNPEDLDWAAEFRLKEDSIVVGHRDSDPYFPGELSIKGKLVFHPYLKNYNGLLIALKKPKESSFTKVDSRTGQTLYGKSYTFKETLFNLFFVFKRPPYRDLIKARAEVTIYQNPSMKSKEKGHFNSGEFIAVVKDSLDWLKVNRLRVVADTARYFTPGKGWVHGSAKLQLVKGWGHREDLWGPWVKQHVHSKSFSFAVSGAEPEHSWDRYGIVNAIKITNIKTGKVQLIAPVGATLLDDLDDVVRLQDCNFDGYPDIRIFAHTGGAGPNSGDNFYLYDPQNKQFEYNQKLSDLIYPQIDSIAHTITTSWRDGCCHHGGETYTFKADTLSEISEWNSHWVGGRFSQYYTSKLVDGKWQDTTRYSTYLQNDRIYLYRTPKLKTKPIGKITNASITIYDETPLWFKVETKIDKASKMGWVFKPDFFHHWEPYHIETSRFRFAASVSDGGSVDAIKIINKRKQKVIQIVTLYKSVSFEKKGLKVIQPSGKSGLRILLTSRYNGKTSIQQKLKYNIQKEMFVKENENTAKQ